MNVLTAAPRDDPAWIMTDKLGRAVYTLNVDALYEAETEEGRSASIADALAERLRATATLKLTPSDNLFAGGSVNLPDKPGPLVRVIQRGGFPDVVAHSDLRAIRRQSVQVLVCGTDEIKTYGLAQRVCDRLTFSNVALTAAAN